MKFPIRLIRNNTDIKFLSYRKVCFIISSLLIAISISFLFLKGLNYGIDFKGGTLIEIQKITGDADVGHIRELIKNIDIGDVQIQEFGNSTDVLIRVEQQMGGDSAQQNVIKLVKGVIGSQYEFRRVEVVGPKVSSELIYSGILAVLLAIVAVVLYIWFRFEWQFSIGAMLALMHDIIITIGLFSILQLEFNLSIIAAILTIVGYSLNDTVVVYDRIREELRKYKSMNFLDLLNLAVNATLSRTTITSVTTILALLSLYIFGGEVIRGFTFAMIWGVIIGTYSSIFIAAPVLLYLNIKRDWSDS
ncbi:protein translocase subunit SecF [Hyphomicrobiales bacterium]|jgi:preprotein translocase subunit SecF|nr:protein translocase subunit SecF [Rhodobiaceae bacterium]MDB4127959.1 protein translocase subunit SecF [Hyphomicrobiales bacterium]MDC3271924.1 protein translocase subunit SecF [Hyphomicrobiales bacterium]|tara:strand:+ start:815 stop:1726 length:912 start_codon:yes stop_codon:yes gene_type:complete